MSSIWERERIVSREDPPAVAEEERSCGVCGVKAKEKCSECKLIYYCGREHQKLDWKRHSKNCECLKVGIDSRVGRHYVAKRKIDIGRIVLREEEALLAWPAEGTPPICLSCNAILRADYSRECEKCGWPLCRDCKSHDRTGECDFTIKHRASGVSINDFEIPHPTYKSIGVIRALAMRENKPEAYRRLINLEDHCREASERAELLSRYRNLHDYEDRDPVGAGGGDTPRDVARFVKRFFKLDHLTDHEIAKIVGILRINGHEVPTTENLHVAIYDRASYIEHNCRANCSKSFTENGGIVIRAAVPISKGDHISICYTDPLWGVANRRHYLAQTKFFDCTCDRCTDPTEFGTMFNALKCITKDCNGDMLPPSFIITDDDDDEYPDYACSKCPATISWQRVEMLQEKIGIELSKMKKDDIESCKKFIEHHSKIIHENHFYNVDVKSALALLIGQETGGLPAVSDHLLNEKILICQKLGALYETLVPAENRIRGILLFEMHAAIAEFARRQSSPDASYTLLVESRKVLAESYQLLRNEPTILPEGKLAKQALKNLREMDMIIETILEKQTASPPPPPPPPPPPQLN